MNNSLIQTKPRCSSCGDFLGRSEFMSRGPIPDGKFDNTDLCVTYNDICDASLRIRGKIHWTPVHTCTTLDTIVGRKVYLKCENFQKTGSFKARGALNVLLKLRGSENNTVRGVFTHSSGNHGQGLAWAARVVGIPCKIVVPYVTPKVKVEAIEGYGAEVVKCPELTYKSIMSTCKKVQEESDYHEISAHDSYDVIAGQGTIALEFLEQVPQLDAILVCVSGGGMATGIGVAAKAIKPGIKVYCVEPFGKDLEASIRAGKPLWTGRPTFVDTIAEGLRTRPINKKVFQVLVNNVEKEVFSITNEEIVEALKFTWQRIKLVIENSSAAGIAAVMSEKIKSLDPSIQHVGVVVCGGNVDMDNLPWI